MEKDIQNKLDKYDVALSIASGALTATLDVFWVKDLSFEDAHKWGSKKVDEFVISIAQSKGYKGDTIFGAIKTIEDAYPMDGDLLTANFGGGAQHHLRDFSHHPTPVGLMFSVLMQFTGKGFGTDPTGKFESYDIPGWRKKDFTEAMYLGTIGWMFHMISDIAGSSGTRRGGGEGTGLPGPLLSFLKEISSIPGIRNIAGKTEADKSPNKTANYEFSVICSKLFNGTLLGEHDENGKPVRGEQLRFDLRTELGIVKESINNKQYLPVVLNELIVASFYSVRRFMLQIAESGYENIKDIEKIDIFKCLPWKNEAIRHMRMIATSTFTTIDLSVAGIKAALKNKDNPSGFALDFMQGINYWGLGNLALATNSEFMLAIKKMQTGFLSIAETQKQKILEKLPNGQETWKTGKFGIETAISIAKIGTPIGFISASVGVYDEINKALGDLKIAAEERMRIENECLERIAVIQAYQHEMNLVVSNYLYEKQTVFTKALSKMDQAVAENDVEAFLLGNHMIQTELSGKSIFKTMDEFDELMLGEDALEL